MNKRDEKETERERRDDCSIRLVFLTRESGSVPPAFQFNQITRGEREGARE